MVKQAQGHGGLRREMSKQREFVVLNYYHDGCPFDFTLELHKVEESIEDHKLNIDHAEKNNLEVASMSALPDLIADLRFIKEVLKGRFDILVIVEKDYDGHIDCSDVNMACSVEGGN